MNRELKFRAWDILAKKIRNDITGFECFPDGNINGVFLDGSFYRLGNKTYAPTAELMQFTGLKDCNGKSIFEGDVVRIRANPEDYGGYKGHDYIEAVEWDDFSLGFILSGGCGLRDFSNIEVLGNIYENSELIKDKDD